MKQIVYSVYEIFNGRILLRKATFSKHRHAREYMEDWQRIKPESVYYIEPHAKRKGERVV